MSFSVKSRNYGIDALKIFSMFLIVVLHVLGHGGLLAASKPLSWHYEALWLMETAAYCAVNCYALVSGYVNISAKYRYSNIILIWLRTVFYSVIISVVFFAISPSEFGIKNLLFAFFPIFKHYYWYITAYFGLFFFIPIINKAINSLNKKQATYVSASLFVFFSLFQTLFNDVFNTGNGYSALWLIILYIIGACIKKFNFFENIGKLKALIGYVFCTLLSWGYQCVFLSYLQRAGKKTFFSDYHLVTYISPTIFAAALFLFILFKQLTLKPLAIKCATVLSPLTLSVYLIHVNPHIWQSDIWKQIAKLSKYSSPITLLCAFCVTLCIFVVCCAIDMIRESLFKFLKLKKHLTEFENKLTKGLWLD